MRLTLALPVHNEEIIIARNVLKLRDFLQNNFSDYDWRIIIADNASFDRTASLAKESAAKDQRIKYLFIPEKGKGLAVKKAWQNFPADIYAFMDADLSTNLESLTPLLSAIAKEGFDIAIGSRFHRDSKVKRTFFRITLSWILNNILRIFFGLKIKDTTCGFKAVNQRTIDEILPQVENNGWFFDTELLVLAYSKSFRIIEVPVDWQDEREEKRKSKVQPVSLSFDYLKEIIKLRFRLK